ncbi:bifunctional diaminohydroxyphosphoribosylaminopyrimidine deaminase/5-amino-6-(5-phosphoribosylamino)uracil reductase RibD [Pseudidiomarina andamanensis]|uniref:Riboflavin biosynthesis protein RibD n=1 Tax=Pseudidiomarina andamanensis TaxID=1940690 RepID=A0AA92EQ50_9GAMM|nr:bifunctional diaminohydroxyphosphoribosylaminopyrimidine deaminase/5-amino-6-(5-phosphoribosylamino)uracil reductase RibD [Pseudidiomarina andamanensis]MDS0218021.1 bifunctional diaminohydroxyphosphoribosylaminopyrimidine deaminase/5-amino-6-(5-phosphoribosylamino)uracil reductase RibD [Pseudidiomarina andamanensis]QGT94912.1 bifunctional diaminohydroxyphosphoribosylaminopyrimidine deaminase/5-amino-6-(5-phosphoribosylamino)uracil reductase RibD [Pseudidiomarina andamanensis]
MTDPQACHQRYMQRALELAAQGRFSTAPNPMVGCVVVADGKIVGEGWHQRAGEPHAEVYALGEAGALAKGAAVYVTLEPCSHFGRTPPCADALIKAEVATVVVAMKDPNPLVSGEGIERLRANGIEVIVGILEQQALALNNGFVARMQRQRPWLRVKMAASLDGRTALSNGESQWITSTDARRDVHRWRAQSGAILSTAKTVLADNAILTARHPQAERQPTRVIIDSQGLLTGQEALFKEPFPIIVVHAPDTIVERTWAAHVECITIVRTNNGHIDLTQLMHVLADKQVNSVWTECGAQLAGALLTAELVDELVLYLAPKLMGHHGHGLLNLPAFTHMSQVPELTLKDVRQVADDVRIIAVPRRVRGDLTS